MTSVYSKEAIDALSEAEKLRFVLAYLHHNDPRNVDWAAAAALSGSKSVASFKVMFNNTLKKLHNASAGANGAAGDGTDTPKATPKKRGKSAVDAHDDEKIQSPKKRDRQKATKKPVLPARVEKEEEIEEAIRGAVKAEPASESFFDLEEGY
ncbi:hypothetical protein B0J12DRAFT_763353 [Macrophomina phaseolina]|uniref:Uncharacterized protein n=1 Tax=Macrophomina phaseolina TaxID=35725 RepID=A0ABQ8GQ10_9PEZI|nr:hypothetical protein B0J12DRAFT_763353 [Macrophomina phaseolina]